MRSMHGFRRIQAAALAVLISGGCNSAAKRSLPASEPGLSASVVEPGVATVEPPQVAQSSTFLDRHPLFSKPKQYYDNTNNNKIVKTAAGTFVGVPAGIFGELKQIVAGKPTATPAPY